MNEIEMLKREIELLKADMRELKNSTTISYDTEQALRTRLQIPDITDLSALLSLSGVLYGDGSGNFSAQTPLSGTRVYYVSDSSGGAVTRKLTFINGVLTSQT